MNRRADPKTLDRYFRGIDQALSRTATTGSVATGVHGSKRPALVAGDQLLEAIGRNRFVAAEFIGWQAAHLPTAADGVAAAVTALGWLVNLGISDGGLYRMWPYEVPRVEGSSPSPGILAADITAGIGNLACECLDLGGRPGVEKARRIARIEWEIGVGPLHPFYDGCGRASRYFSALLCLWHQVPLPTHASRDAYMQAAREGDAAFAEYWASAPTVPPTEFDLP